MYQGNNAGFAVTNNPYYKKVGEIRKIREYVSYKEELLKEIELESKSKEDAKLLTN